MRTVIKSNSHHWLRGSPGYGLAEASQAAYLCIAALGPNVRFCRVECVRVLTWPAVELALGNPEVQIGAFCVFAET
jgi:hypothetical protein